jgi:hypothetical protein
MPFSQRIFSLLSFGRAPDPPPADMRTLPCTGLDLLVPNNIITTGFIIDTRLDAKLLEQTLSTLVEFRFPRAGARLARRNGVSMIALLLSNSQTESYCKGVRVPDSSKVRYRHPTRRFQRR